MQEGTVGPFLNAFYATLSFGAPAEGAPQRRAAGVRNVNGKNVGWHVWGTDVSIHVVGVTVEADEADDSWTSLVQEAAKQVLAAANIYSRAGAVAQPAELPVAWMIRGDSILPTDCPLHTITPNLDAIRYDIIGHYLGTAPNSSSANTFFSLYAEAKCVFIPLHYRILALMRIIEFIQQSEKTQSWMDAYNADFSKLSISNQKLKNVYPRLRARIAHGYNNENKIYTAWNVNEDGFFIKLFGFLDRLVLSEVNRRGIMQITEIDI